MCDLLIVELSQEDFFFFSVKFVLDHQMDCKQQRYLLFHFFREACKNGQIKWAHFKDFNVG